MLSTQKATPIEKIVEQAKCWRRADKDAIASKGDPVKQRSEYLERRTLAKIIDDANAKAGQP